jgi:hypothetical protein
MILSDGIKSFTIITTDAKLNFEKYATLGETPWPGLLWAALNDVTLLKIS